MHFLSPKYHSFIDIAAILALLIAPSAMDFPREAATTSYILAAAYAVLVALTAYPLGIAKVIPFTVHGTIELVLSPLLIAMPWLAGFSADEPARWFFVAMGAALFVVWLITDYKAADIGYGKRGVGVKPGHPRTA